MMKEAKKPAGKWPTSGWFYHIVANALEALRPNSGPDL
jgi:hypothetical protein